MATTADIFYPETSNADSLKSNKGRQKKRGGRVGKANSSRKTRAIVSGCFSGEHQASGFALKSMLIQKRSTAMGLLSEKKPKELYKKKSSGWFHSQIA